MIRLCACGRPATRRLRWHPWLETVEPRPSRKPTHCLDCAVRDAALRTARHREELERERRDFPDASRLTYRSDVPVPETWTKLARAEAMRHPEIINPGGLVRTWRQDKYLWVDLYPPQERPATWNPINCLYLLRYLMRRPVVFVPVDREQNPSPSTWRESAEQWSATIPPVTLPAESDGNN